jgi:hypothetical protein
MSSPVSTNTPTVAVQPINVTKHDGQTNVAASPAVVPPPVVAPPTIEDAKVIVANFTNIFARFKVISSLQGGYKIWITSNPVTHVKTFSIDNSYVPPLTRWYHAQNREEIINTIIDDTNYIHSHYNKLNQKAKETLKNVINSALIGLKNMKETYNAVKLHEESLQNVIETLTGYATRPSHV